MIMSREDCSVSFLVADHGGFVEDAELVGVVLHMVEGHCRGACCI
jgi:hypothetical protein